MSKRLDSITRSSAPSGTPTGAKPALKFKPKVVSRKTKEERENAGKISTPGVNKIVEKNNRRLTKKPGPGAAGGRTNKKLTGTQLVISGPLSEGAISLGGSATYNSSSGSGGKNPMNPLLDRLKSKSQAKALKNSKIKSENGERNLKVFDDSDSDIDDNAIDMGKKSLLGDDLVDGDGDLDMEKIDTDLFPVRAERNEHREYGEETKVDKTIKTEFRSEKSVIPSETPSREPTADVIPVSGDSSKSRAIINEDDANLHMNNFQEQLETKQMEEDYNILSKNLKSLDLENNMFFLQVPCSLPVFEGGLDGQIGKIRIHKSGKMTMNIGKVKFEVLRGGSSDFRQDVVLVDKEKGSCYHVGNVKDKITAIPKIL